MTLTRRDALKILGTGAAVTLLPRRAAGRGGDSPDPEAPADVVILGAGFAGLAAARELRRSGKSVFVLEARDRVGGRVKAGEIAGRSVDLGGMWVGPRQPRLLALLDEHGIARTPQYIRGNGIVEIAGARRFAPGEETPLGPAGDAAIRRMFARIGALTRDVPLESPWTTPKAEEWDRVTMEEWLRGQTRDPAARSLMRLVVRGLCTAEPEQVSLLFFLSYVRSGGTLEEMWSVQDGAQAFHVPGGMHRLATQMGSELGDRLRLASPATAIAQDDSGVTVAAGGKSVRARYAIVAVPLPLSSRIAYDPPLPARRDALTQRSPMGAVIKYWVAYREPFWRKKNQNGYLTSDRPPTDSFFDASPPDEGVGLLVGFIEAQAGLTWMGKPASERRDAIVSRVADVLGPQGAEAIDYVDADWSSEPWTRGCYGAFLVPGALTALGPALREPFGRVHWAGSESSPIWTGYIEGALQSGERAAAEVSRRLG